MNGGILSILSIIFLYIFLKNPGKEPKNVGFNTLISSIRFYMSPLLYPILNPWTVDET